MNLHLKESLVFMTGWGNPQLNYILGYRIYTVVNYGPVSLVNKKNSYISENKKKRHVLYYILLQYPSVYIQALICITTLCGSQVLWRSNTTKEKTNHTHWLFSAAKHPSAQSLKCQMKPLLALWCGKPHRHRRWHSGWGNIGPRHRLGVTADLWLLACCRYTMIGSGAQDRKEADGGWGASQQEHLQGGCMQGRRDSWGRSQ